LPLQKQKIYSNNNKQYKAYPSHYNFSSVSYQ
jgi:hypothetical protein